MSKMTERRKQRNEYRSWKKGYYHLSTDGWKEGCLFHTPAQYAYGMILIGLLVLKYSLKIYSFSLMPNHIHLVLCATGNACVEAFDYFRKKINERLVKDGYPPLPPDYGFNLAPITTEKQMRNNIIYVDRNVLEKQICVPGGYPWSSCYLQFGQVDGLLGGERAGSMSKRHLRELTGSHEEIPADWLFHPQMGLLPSCFVDSSMFYKLFRTPKEYMTHLVKDYEAFVEVANLLNETPEYSKDEADDLVQKLLRESFSGRRLNSLTNDEKGRLAVLLSQHYQMSADQIAEVLKLPPYLINQFLNAKDYGKKKR